jgi:MFS family permease
LATVQTLPFLLLSIPLGLLADRVSRRQLMVIAEAVRAASLAVLFLAVVYGYVTMPLLVVLGFVGACGTVAFNVAGPAFLPSLVARLNGGLYSGRVWRWHGGGCFTLASAIAAC